MLSAKVRGFSGGNLKVMEGVGVGQNGSVLLVKAGRKFILIGVTKDRVTYLTELDEADIELKEPQAPGRFDSYLTNFMKGKKNER